MPSQYEECKTHLAQVAAEFATECPDSKSRNEATTRIRWIDRIFFECLDWDRADCIAEEKNGPDYLDYCFYAPRRALIVEAKKTDTCFELPAGYDKLTYKLTNLTAGNLDVRKAVEQVARYSFDTGTRLVCVSNGWQFIAFVALTYGRAYLEGSALVFDSLGRVLENFTEFWNALSKKGVQASLLAKMVAVDALSTPPPKLSTRIEDFPGLKRRNTIQSELEILSDLLIEELSEFTEIRSQFLDQCYSSSGALSQYTEVCKNILMNRYANLFQNIGTPYLRPATEKHDKIDEGILSPDASSRPILLIGDVGVGKTTFVRHLFHVIFPREDPDTLLFHVDLGIGAAISKDLTAFVVSEIERQLHTPYQIDPREDAFIRGVYHLHLDQFHAGIAARLKTADPARFALEEYQFLKSRMDDGASHIKAVISHLVRGRNKKPILVIDNVDQRDEQDQQQAFLVATEFAAANQIPVFLALRPETFQRSQRMGSLSGYHPVAYTVSPPRLDDVLAKRLNFSLKILRGEVALKRLKNVRFNLKNLYAFLMVFVQNLNDNESLFRFFDNVSNGNVRLALDFVNTFVKSGHINTKEILGIFRDTGSYTIPLHAVQRAILYGEHAFYHAPTSPIMNLFDISAPDGKEHFLCWIILDHLQTRSYSIGEGGFVPLQEMYVHCQDLRYTDLQVGYAIDRLLRGRMMEDNLHSNITKPQVDILMYRPTSLGAYLLNSMSTTFVYVDAMLYDTPVTDPKVSNSIRIGDLPIAERLNNATVFVDYLQSLTTRVPDKTQYLDDALQKIQDDIQKVRRRIQR